MSYHKGQQSGQATTNNLGAFSIPVRGPANFSGGLLSIAGNGPGCVDALTQLAPPFTVGALVPQGTGMIPFQVYSATILDPLIVQNPGMQENLPTVHAVIHYHRSSCPLHTLLAPLNLIPPTSNWQSTVVLDLCLILINGRRSKKATLHVRTIT